jgi:hypothetical protein
VSFKKRLRTIFLCAALKLGLLIGVPMPPEEVRALMNQMKPAEARARVTGPRRERQPPAGRDRRLTPRGHCLAAKTSLDVLMWRWPSVFR